MADTTVRNKWEVALSLLSLSKYSTRTKSRLLNVSGENNYLRAFKNTQWCPIT